MKDYENVKLVNLSSCTAVQLPLISCIISKNNDFGVGGNVKFFTEANFEHKIHHSEPENYPLTIYIQIKLIYGTVFWDMIQSVSKSCPSGELNSLNKALFFWGGGVAARLTWWSHQMETFSAQLAICVFAGNSPVTGEFSVQRPVSFDVFFDLRLNSELVIWDAIAPIMTSLSWTQHF